MKCPKEKIEYAIPKEIIAQKGSVYESIETIIAIAENRKEVTQSPYIILPFCSTVEAKSLGGDIVPWDDTAGPRPGKYVINNLDELKFVNISESVWAKNILSAISYFTQKGETVIYELSGPLTILSSLMPTGKLFSQWRRSENKMQEVFKGFEDILLSFLSDIYIAGAKIISYADPSGNPDILGPKYSDKVAIDFTKPFLSKALEQASTVNGKFLICPIMGQKLVELDVLETAVEREGNLSIMCVSVLKESIKTTHRLKDSNFR